MSVLDRILLLATGLLAAYQVAVGIEGLGALAILCYTIGFGVLLIASLLLIILGFEVLDNPLVVVVAAIIPLSLSLGLVVGYLPTITAAYQVFVILGLLAILITRYVTPGTIATAVLAVVHGIAGLLITGLPALLSLRGSAPAGFALVGVGGALIGVGGLLLAFLRAGKPILSEEVIYAILPGVLLLMTAALVVGFALA
jgi:hypothetical protein